MHLVARSSKQAPVILAVTYTFVPRAEPTAVGFRRRMASQPNAESSTSRSVLPNPTNSERRGTKLGGNEN